MSAGGGPAVELTYTDRERRLVVWPAILGFGFDFCSLIFPAVPHGDSRVRIRSDAAAQTTKEAARRRRAASKCGRC